MDEPDSPPLLNRISAHGLRVWKTDGRRVEEPSPTSMVEVITGCQQRIAFGRPIDETITWRRSCVRPQFVKQWCGPSISIFSSASGRKPAARAYDALIAASAIAHAVPLYTCNPDDFAVIPRLELRPVTDPHDR